MSWSFDHDSVLVADDDAEVVSLLSKCFKEVGIHSVCASEGSEAKKFVENQKFAAILLDLNMPSLKGLQVAERARNSRANKETPIYIMSGYIERETLIRGHGLGVNGLFAKPFSLKELVGRVLSELDEKNRPDSKHPVILKSFMTGAIEVLQKYFPDHVCNVGTAIFRGKSAPRPSFATSLISFKNRDYLGSAALGLSAPFIKEWSKQVFSGESKDLDRKALESITNELCNQFWGVANGHLEREKLIFESSIPVTNIGKGHKVDHATRANPIAIPLLINELQIEFEFALDRQIPGEDLQVGKVGDDKEEVQLDFEDH